jgi:hypothetical protein
VTVVGTIETGTEVTVTTSQVLLEVEVVGSVDDSDVLALIVTVVGVHPVACEHGAQLDVVVIVFVDGVVTDVTVLVEVDAQVLTVTVLVTGLHTVGLQVPVDELVPEDEGLDTVDVLPCPVGELNPEEEVDNVDERVLLGGDEDCPYDFVVGYHGPQAWPSAVTQAENTKISI